MTPPTNASAADTLDQYAVLLELSGESPFRVRAYQRAAASIRGLDRPLAEIAGAGRLQSVPGIGAGIAAALTELLDTGRFPPLDDLRRQIPLSLLEVLQVPGVGVRTATRLYRELGIVDLETLAAAIDAGRLRTLSGMSAKTEDRIRAGIDAVKRRTGRLRLGTAFPRAAAFVAAIQGLVPNIPASLAGSVRRLEETVADLDVVVGSTAPSGVLDAIAGMPQLDRILDRRSTHLRAVLAGGIPVDVYVVPPHRFGTELVRATGSSAHLQLLGDQLPDAATEEALYAALGLPPIPPELRVGRDEVTWARTGHLDRIITAAQIRGEFHSHTTWSDGTASVLDMAAAALAAGYDFLGVSDHSHGLGIANGLDAARLAAQRREIDAANRRAGLRVFAGAEVEVSRDGRLDFDDATLAGLDVVVVSLHSGLRQPRDELTDRLIGVLRNPHVDIIAHPSGRLIEQREGGDFDWDRVFAVAAETDTALEINADPARLDLSENLARGALAAGCLLTINGDAHHPEALARLGYGIAIARRAGATPARVLNCWPIPDIERWLVNRSRPNPTGGGPSTTNTGFG